MPVFLGADSAPYRAIVQVEGHAWRMRADAFKFETRLSTALHKRLLLYTQALMAQMSQMAACNCLHTVEERLCSLLLMIHDRMGSDEFLLTHEVIADLLGSRRAGITVAAGKLRQMGAISSVRGHIHVLDRRLLELAACECYRAVKLEFDRLLEGEAEDRFSLLPVVAHWNGPAVNEAMNHGRESIRPT